MWKTNKMQNGAYSMLPFEYFLKDLYTHLYLHILLLKDKEETKYSDGL